MDDHLKEIFALEIARQASYALAAEQAMSEALGRTDTDAFWFYSHAFLSAAANVSKLLWGTSSQAAKRRKSLRDDLGVTDESPLADRSFRNHFEHFDERIEAWDRSDPHRIYVDSNIGPTSMIGGLDSSAFLRNYDPAKREFTFRGESFLMGPIVPALSAVREAATRHRDRRLGHE